MLEGLTLHLTQHWPTHLTLLTLLAETVAKRALTARLPAPPLCMRSRPLQSAVPSHELDMRCAPPARRVPLPLLVEPGPPTCGRCQDAEKPGAIPIKMLEIQVQSICCGGRHVLAV